MATLTSNSCVGEVNSPVQRSQQNMASDRGGGYVGYDWEEDDDEAMARLVATSSDEEEEDYSGYEDYDQADGCQRALLLFRNYGFPLRQ